MPEREALALKKMQLGHNKQWSLVRGFFFERLEHKCFLFFFFLIFFFFLSFCWKKKDTML